MLSEEDNENDPFGQVKNDAYILYYYFRKDREGAAKAIDEHGGGHPVKQRKTGFIGMLIFLLFLVTACGEEDEQEKEKAEPSRYEEEQQAEQLSLEEWYAVLNKQEPLKLSLKEEDEEGIFRILRDNQPEYDEMLYSGDLVPQELVGRLEEALYAYCKFGKDRSEQPYEELLKELGGGSYRMTEAEIQEVFPENLPDQAFTFKLSNGKRLYLKSHRLKNGRVNHYLWSRNKNEWVLEGDFTTTFIEGEVICYEDSYYYIGLERNRGIDRQLMEDCIQLFRLREQMEVWKDKLSIGYVPEDYQRIPLFSQTEEREEVADYIEDLDAAFAVSKNIDFCGGAEELILREETASIEYSRANMTNAGIPIYIQKNYERDTASNWLYLGVNFYLYDETAHQFLLLDKWQDSYSEKWRREYLWCEEFGGKVYTFQLFRREDYVYIFEVLLLEGDQIRTLQREVWVPQRQIIYKE